MAKDIPIRQVNATAFWARVDVSTPNSCWCFLGANHLQDRTGYGIFINAKARQYAHRTAFRLKKGRIPKHLWVLHRCGNKPCCNPAHLYLGTQKENHWDYRRLMTVPFRPANSILTREQVGEIKRLLAKGAKSQSQIGRMFGVHRSTILNIQLGKAWKNVTIAMGPA